MSAVANAKSLLVITNNNIGGSEYLLLKAYLQALRLKDGLTTHVVSLAGKLEKLDQQHSLVRPDRLTLIQKLAPRKFVLTFAKSENNVKNIQWQQSDKEVNFYISMENGVFQPNGMRFKVEGSTYDTILYFNLQDNSVLEKVFEPYKNLVNEAKHVSIGKPVGVPHQNVEAIQSDKANTLSEIVFEQIKEQLKPDLSTDVLAALLIETNRFKKEVKSANIFSVAAKLVDTGANLNNANQLSDKMANTGGGEQPKPQGQGAQGNQPSGQPADRQGQQGGQSRPQGDRSQQPGQSNQQQSQGERQAQPAAQVNNAQQSGGQPQA